MNKLGRSRAATRPEGRCVSLYTQIVAPVSSVKMLVRFCFKRLDFRFVPRQQHLIIEAGIIVLMVLGHRHILPKQLLLNRDYVRHTFGDA
jgi:hypothetical protein